MRKAQMNHQIGRFAAAFAKSRATPRESRAVTVAPSKVRTFDEIAEMGESTERASRTGIPRQNLPFGAGLQKQRTGSEGEARLRYRGQLVK